jgi:hypothetical protein
MPFWSRLSIVAGCCLLTLLIPGGRVDALGSQPESKGLSDNALALRRRILTHWRARQEQSNSFHYAWDARVTFPKAMNRPVSEAHRELWMDGETRFRLTGSFVEKQQPPGSHIPATGDRPDSVFACDGPTSRELDLQRHTALVRDDDEGQKRLGGIGLFPLLLALRPLSRGGVARASQSLAIVNENELIDNRPCVKLKLDAPIFVDTFWVDPARDDVIVRWERTRPGEIVGTVSIEYQRDKEHGWVPARWSQTTFGITCENTSTSFQLGARIPAATFTVTFPPGTTVVDWPQAEKYVVAKDGSKTDVTKYDSPGTLRIFEALEQTADFAIDEQPLKDALDFIAQRYQIKVTIDGHSLFEGRIDRSTQVKVSTSGMKVKSLLMLLLEQSKKPLTYEIRQGVLNVIPAKK